MDLTSDYGENGTFPINHETDDIYHLGADYAKNGENIEGREFRWTGPDATVISISYSPSTQSNPNNGYGTMLIVLEIELNNNTTFNTEVFSEDLPENHELLQSTTLSTNKIRVTIGHLRTSREKIVNNDPEVRFNEGLETGEISFGIGSKISHGTLIGFFESEEYGGASTNPHAHITMSDANALDQIGGAYTLGVMNHDDPRRKYFIRPELAWPLLTQENA
jgi:hypothetical protein